MLSSLVKVFINAGNNTTLFWTNTLQTVWFIGEVFSNSLDAIRKPKKIRWRETLYYMDMCGREAFFIVALICFLMGLILGFQSAVQMHELGADIFVADLVGFSILKELGPLMVALICTGRAGSAFAAEIATKKLNEEIDAMTTMGFDPIRFLVIPKMLALTIVMPLLTAIGDFFGLLGGLFVGVFQLNIQVATYIDRSQSVLGPIDLMEGITKGLIFAILISGIGCLKGLQSKKDAQGVGRAATSAVVSGIFLVILADTLLTILFTGIYR
jgi:phospholipid/cholesterol/gamma-HCH transport system permease protein